VGRWPLSGLRLWTGNRSEALQCVLPKRKKLQQKARNRREASRNRLQRHRRRDYRRN
jgi:hypothetical protein